MDRIVCIKKEEPVTTSQIISEWTGREHASVIRLIRDNLNDLNEFGRVGFEIAPFETAGGVQKKEIAIINEQQSTLLITYMRNNAQVRMFKKKLVSEFFKMREALRQRQSTEWQQSRLKGKLQRRDETDAIAEYLLPLARKQNPDSTYAKKPRRAYQTYSKLIKVVLGVNWDSRDDLSWQYLNAVEAIERMICVTIKRHADTGTPYKDIYKLCKANALTLVELLCLDGKPLLIESNKE
jgi:phage regulator Rha-like protein